jgi:hypothetical protein
MRRFLGFQRQLKTSLVLFVQVLCLVMLAALLVAAQGATAADAPEASTDLGSAGKQFVDLLVKEDFAGAVSRFDGTMKNALPEARLREVWQRLQDQAGPVH